MSDESGDASASSATPVMDQSVDALTGSSSRWLRQALTSWANEDYAAVAMLAPIALEHLGKAALWKRNPALLVPLATNAEESLRILTLQPDLANSKLRTVGLALVLQRLSRFIDPYPLTADSTKLIVDTRNGSVHVGAKTQSGPLLRDVLTACEALIDDLSLSRSVFYGDQAGNVLGLLDEKRSDTENTVAAKMAKARNHITDLQAKLGATAFLEATSTLEDEAASHDPTGRYPGGIAIDTTCPECASTGRLAGWLDADPQPEWDQEKVGDRYETFLLAVGWDLTLVPNSFACNVCKLSLDGPLELQAAKLPATRTEIDGEELDDDFDFDEFLAESEHIHTPD